ncbi:choice-of-anchor D domain-containing protein [bacterium]|nr:choice-of-anchor D domain-containing protein [bacterium]
MNYRNFKIIIVLLILTLSSLSAEKTDNVGPRRDEPGDEIARFQLPRAAPQAPTYAKNWDTGMMILSTYNGYIDIVDPEELEVVESFEPDIGYQVDCAWLNGIYYILLNNSNHCARFDNDMERLDGDLELPFEDVRGISADNEDGWFIAKQAEGAINVYEMEGDELGDEIGSFDNYRQYMGNHDPYTINWVPAHESGELWVQLRNGGVYSVNIDTEEWEAVETAAHFDSPAQNENWLSGIGHDGYNIWVAVSNNSTCWILEDGIDEEYYTGPRIELSTDTLDFEEVGIELTAELPLTISNTGTENLAVTEITVEGDCFTTNFEEEFTLEPDQDIELTVSFTPAERGEFEAVLTITSNDEENGEVEVPLYGEGVGAVCWFNRRALEFGVVGINESADITISFRNHGLLDLVMSGFNNDNEVFTYNIEDEVTLEPDENCGLTVTFTPTDGIVYQDTLTFHSNDPDKETVTIPMSGRGMGAVIVAEPDTVQFGEVGRNRNAERVINICNEGEINLEISEIFVEGRYFSIDLDTIYVVEPDGSLQCAVTFSPEEIGDFRATLFISSNDRQNEELVIPLYGTGKGPEIAVDSDSLDFGLLAVNESDELILTISAVGLTDLTVTDVEVRGSPTFLSAIENEVFIELNNSFELPVSFNPGTDGLLTGILTVHSDDPENGELEINLAGYAHYGLMLDTLGTVSDVKLMGSHAYLAIQSGLVILDVLVPGDPFVAGTYRNEDLHPVSVCVEGDYAYIATGESGFTIVDISVVDSAQFVSTYDTEGNVHSIAVRDGYAFVADGENGLRVIDLYEPESPFEVNYVDTPGEAYAVTLDGDYAYVADYVQGLRIIEISDPQEPFEAGYFNTRGMSMDVAVSGSLAYVADERYGLRIIDVTDHENPEEIGFYDTDGYAYGVHVTGDHAYVADGSGGMCMLDVSIPASPYPAKIFYTPDLATSVEALDNYAFIADHGDILIIDVSEFLRVDELTKLEIPTSYILKPAFPNPFNAVTSIRYGMPYSTHVSISIYDVSGRMVEELYSGYNTAGFKTVVWNAEGFRSGVYLVKLKASSGFSTVQKVMLIR